MNALPNTETASWLIQPVPGLMRSIRLLLTVKVFRILDKKPLFDGAMISHTGESLVALENFTRPQYPARLVYIEPKV
jgi:hypothetical protein